MAAIPWKMIRHQGPMLKTLGSVALAAARRQQGGSVPDTPGQKLTATIPPVDAALVEAYTDWSGGRAGAYASELPPHLFPQWGFPLISQTIQGLPYNLAGVLNQGCRIKVNSSLPTGQPLNLTAWLEDVSDDGFKARVHQRLITGTADHPQALEADVYAVVLLKKKPGGGSRVEEDLSGFETVGQFSADLQDGLRFGLLTGDLNPIHWIGPYAKASGFKRQILHGFGSFARTYEILNGALDGSIREFDVRFVKPLVLPATASVRIRPTSSGHDVRLEDVNGALCMAGSVVAG